MWTRYFQLILSLVSYKRKCITQKKCLSEICGGCKWAVPQGRSRSQGPKKSKNFCDFWSSAYVWKYYELKEIVYTVCEKKFPFRFSKMRFSLTRPLGDFLSPAVAKGCLVSTNKTTISRLASLNLLDFDLNPQGCIFFT